MFGSYATHGLFDRKRGPSRKKAVKKKRKGKDENFFAGGAGEMP